MKITKMDWTSWCIMLALSLTTRAADCPTGKGAECYVCRKFFNEVINDIICMPSKFNDFYDTVPVPSKKHCVTLGCPNSAITPGRLLNDSYPAECVTTQCPRRCDWPGDDWLKCIAQEFLTDGEDTLVFRLNKNLSSSALTNKSLRDTVHIRELTLWTLGLTEMPDGFLDGLENLTLLHLQENNLQHLPDNFFSASNLKDVNISMNKIESFASTAFDKLRRLFRLNISKNRLANILPHTFDNLASLRTLSIHGNYLGALPSDIFARLANLSFINLSQNNFDADSLPADLLRRNDNLEHVALFENKKNMTSLPKRFFADLTKLKTVELQRNGFTSLPEDLFRGAKNLKNVGLDGNYLSTLQRQIFKDTNQLYMLNVSHNNISHLPNDVFGSLKKLIKLDLSNNRLSTISDKLFRNLVSLQELNMECNELANIDGDAFNFVQKLRVANFSYNALILPRQTLDFRNYNRKWHHNFTDRELYSPFRYCTELEEFDLSHNNIAVIHEDWHRLRRLRVLNLSNNRLCLLTDSDLHFWSDYLTVDVTYNNISTINLGTVDEWAGSQSYARKVTILIENNPIRCNCRVYDLLRYLEGRLHPNAQNAFYLNVGKLKCHGPHDFRDIIVADLKSRTFECDPSRSEFLQARCPNKCKCYLRPENQAFLVNCAFKGLTEAPQELNGPSDYRIEMNLTGNLLTNMPSFDQSGYDNVTILALDHNKISSLSVDKFPHNLEILRLNHNNLTRVNKDVIVLLKNASSLKMLTLRANPWSCDCEAHDLLKFIQSSNIEIPDLLRVNCFGNDNPIVEMSPDDLCPKGTAWIICTGLGVAFLGIIVGTLAALYYRYQREVKVWLYARQWCLWLVTEDELDKDKLYDAFISYSHKDENFVLNNLVPNLEDGPTPFKLCIHFRDWLAGEWIPNQIARSVEDSKRTIVVLSSNFLESVWGRMEFRTAHSQALSEGRARVIVILYGNIGPIDDLDPELKAYLSMNTYVEWGEPWFWEKLRYALPHPPEFKRRNTTTKIFSITQPPVNNYTHELKDLADVRLTLPPATAITV